MWEKLKRDDLMAAVKRAGGGDTLVATEILSTVELWLAERFGKQVSQLAEPAAVVGNVLRIKSSSPPLSREIKQNEQALLNAVRTAHPDTKIDRLQIT